MPPATAERIAHLPPVGSLFAAFLGYNPIRTLLGPAALVMSVVAAGASWLRGGRYVHEELDQPAPAAARSGG